MCDDLPKPLSPEAFLEAMKACCSKTDTSISHIDSDELMENQLIALGFGEAIELLRSRSRWYE